MKLDHFMVYQTIFFLGRRIYFRGQIDNQDGRKWGGGTLHPFFVTSLLLKLEERLIYKTWGLLGRRIYFQGHIDNQERREEGGSAPHLFFCNFHIIRV